MAKSLSVAIMQPTYLPWLGYFDLMDQVDIFVYLDSVQFNKRSWQQRNRIRAKESEMMLTVPVKVKGRYKQTICETELELSQGFQKKHLGCIKNYYSKAPYFNEIYPELESTLLKEHHLLVDLNIELTNWIAQKLGIKQNIRRSSKLDLEGNKDELLVCICKTLHARRYVSAQGSRVYLDQCSLFEENNIELIYQCFEPQPYQQLSTPFLPSLSALDALMNLGGVGSMEILQLGRKD
jgi:hypothetical protein